MRKATQVAKRAVAMTALAFRASMEVTEHPRSAALSQRLLGWLEFFDVATELEPLERDLLQTPYGQLDKKQLREANWSGEAAWVLAWAIGQAELPPDHVPVDYRLLFERLRIMRKEVRDVLTGARLRSDNELIAFCVGAWAFRSKLHQRRLEGESQKLLAKIERKRLEELGLIPSEAAIVEAARKVDGLTEEERQGAAGPAFIREHAAFWLFSERATYFQS